MTAIPCTIDTETLDLLVRHLRIVANSPAHQTLFNLPSMQSLLGRLAGVIESLPDKEWAQESALSKELSEAGASVLILAQLAELDARAKRVKERETALDKRLRDMRKQLTQMAKDI